MMAAGHWVLRIACLTSTLDVSWGVVGSLGDWAVGMGEAGLGRLHSKNILAADVFEQCADQTPVRTTRKPLR